MFEAHRAYFITNRTVQGRHFLTPSPRVNNLVGGVLARALAIYSVKLHAFVFLSNHFHLIATAAHGGDLSRFVGYVEANIAREIGRLIDWRGPFWERRFSAEPILDDDAMLARLRYVLSHGVKEGLVERAEQWPGLTCIPELVHGCKRLFPWYDRTAQYWARYRGESDAEARFAKTHDLKLVAPPCWQNLSAADRLAAAARLLAEANAEASAARDGKPSLGVDEILKQHPLSAPGHVKRAPRPLCHGSTVEIVRTFRAAYRDFVAAYHEASALFRKGNVGVEFPDGSFRPPIPFGWCVSVGASAAFG